MPKSKAQREKRAAKRRAKRAAKAATTGAVVRHALGGGGKYHARPVQIKGRGNYFSDAAKSVAEIATYKPSTAVGKVAQSAAEGLASALGAGAIAKPIGSAASWITRFFGGGNYGAGFNTLSSNSMLGRIGVDQASGFKTNAMATFASGVQSIRFQHSEFVQNILSSAEFGIETFAINPGNPILFPWGHQLAGLYEEAKINGLIFEYRPTSAEAVGTTSSGMGVVVQATEYDVYDDNFDSKESMENSLFSVSCMPYEQQYHPIECKSKWNPTNQLMVEQGLTSSKDATGDARFSCLGNFSIATEGQQHDGDAIGELWVHYDMTLSRPTIEANVINFSQHFDIAYNGAENAWSVLYNSLPTTGFQFSGNETHITLTLPESMQSGEYLVTAIYLYPSSPVGTIVAPSGGAWLVPGTDCEIMSLLPSRSGAPDFMPYTHSAADTGGIWSGGVNTASAVALVSCDLPGVTNFTCYLPNTTSSSDNTVASFLITSFDGNFNARRERKRLRAMGSSGSAIQMLQRQVAELQRKGTHSGVAPQLQTDRPPWYKQRVVKSKRAVAKKPVPTSMSSISRIDEDEDEECNGASDAEDENDPGVPGLMERCEDGGARWRNMTPAEITEHERKEALSRRRILENSLVSSATSSSPIAKMHANALKRAAERRKLGVRRNALSSGETEAAGSSAAARPPGFIDSYDQVKDPDTLTMDKKSCEEDSDDYRSVRSVKVPPSTK